MPGPYDGLRVVEISEGVGGPMAAMLLADLGAAVVKVEPPQGDRLRKTPAFHVLNRSKRGVVRNLQNPADRARLEPLLSRADIVIQGGLPDQYDPIGLGADALLRANPRLIVLQVPYYGSAGPLRETPEDETLLAAMSGMLQQQWAYADQPIALTIPLAGYAHAIMAANAVAAALVEREASGRGQVVECSGLGGAYAFQSGSFVFGDQTSLMSGLRDPKGVSPGYSLYEAAGGEWFFVGCLTPAFWTKLLLILDLPELLADPELQDGPLAMTDPGISARVRAHLAPVFASQSREHWMQVLAEADVPRGPVQTRLEFMAEPQVRHMNMAVTVEDPELGPTRQMGVPLSFSATPGAVQGPAPQLDALAPLPDWPAQPATVSTSATRSRAPLVGTVVLDLATFIAGAYAPMVLADLGADVIKVEPHTGDPFRQFGYGFQGWNRGKRSLSLDLKSDVGRETFYQLVKRADVVVDNFRVGVLERLGLSYQALHAINPRIVMVSVTANGRSGPLAPLPGYDPILQARSGAMRAQGGDGHEPVYYQVAISDYAAATMAAFGAMSALYVRARTGEGQYVNTSLLQNAMTVQAGQFLDAAGQPSDPPGGPDLIGWQALNRSYRCAGDGWFYLVVRNDQEWAGFARALGRQDWLERWDGSAARAEAVGSRLSDEIAATVRELDRDELVAGLVRARVPAAPCLVASEALTHPHAVANALDWRTEHPVWGRVHQTGAFARFQATPAHLQRPSPETGQHSREVLQQLGFDSPTIDGLIDDGVVVQWAGGT